MRFLSEFLKSDREYGELLSAVKQNRLPLAAVGLSQIHKAVLTSALAEHLNKKTVLLTHDEASAYELCDNLVGLGKKALLLPSRDYNLSDIEGFSREYEQKRIDTLSKLLDGDFDVVCIPLDAAVQYTLPPHILKASAVSLRVGEETDIKALCESLTEAGYVRSELTDGKGLFSVRGGIVDIFPSDAQVPYRIEFWGDEIDSISAFDYETQRRMETVEEIKISTAREIVFSPIKLAEKLENYLKSRKKFTESQRSRIESDIDNLKNGIGISPDRYLPLVYDGENTVFDYVKDCLIIVCESGNISERLKTLALQQGEDIKALLEEGFLTKATSELWLDKTELFSYLDNAVFFENFGRNTYEMPLKELLQFSYKRSTAWGGDVNILIEDVSYILSKKGTAVVLAGEEKAAKILAEELNEKGIKAVFNPLPDVLPRGSVTVTVGGLSSGIEIPALDFLLITHRYIQSDTKKRVKRPKNAKSIGSLDELKKGDYVVHTIHGIGIFDGINRITNGGVTKDYIKIKYNGTDVLYVPVTQLDLVSKYIGAAEDGHIRLNKLGGSEWQRTRSRVKAAVKDMAKQLTALYAKRMSTKGYAFSPDTDLQNNFERRFEYDETEDQLRCINEIKNDMERAVPMDRLLCGDVGFGKTEVALRAAFKCISEGKQCALLVPTTILAMQHYNTILRRFGEMPVTVKLLSRFVTPKQQEKIISDLKKGRVDMVVGTHRLISKDVAFKDIGLVIIDEEQRFGVAQKERLKELYPFVDILTLSATPIPRTLNMAMSGLRDMSTIDEAPGDRHPVQTYVLEYNQNLLVDAINKEIRRGGQVYYLHNRVDDITRTAARLKERIPEARIGIAHGKMSEDELSEIWRKLVEQEIDVLVCTTIIETGVDVPNANTLIIEDADRMGLSQLHQLRGRVGRSPRRAYAYFCFKRGRQLSEISAKRLEAIREYTEFGSGFKIALRDLEIRGAGSILGGEQHGNMEAVGYDMYLKLLSDAVNEENGVEITETAECTVDLNVSAHIPESYIESLSARLGIYKRIADIKDGEDVSDVIDELCDRFGEPPKSVMGLIDIALLRNKAAAVGITEITGTPVNVILHVKSLNTELISKLSEKFSGRFSVSASGKPTLQIRLQKGEKVNSLVADLVKVL